MPQLDKLVFMSQLFWLTLTFLTLYIFVLKYILPTVAKTLKLRKKQISMNRNKTSAFENETDIIHAGYDNVLEKALRNSRKSLLKTIELSGNWSTKVLADINNNLFIDANKQFLKSSADIIGKNHLIKNMIKSS